MAYRDELLEAAKLLIERQPGERGRLPDARVRRSVSTTYYALFHFLSEEMSLRVVGTRNEHRQRRRVLSRVITHRGVRLALTKVSGAAIDATVATLFSVGPFGGATPPPPPFVRNIARTFNEAHTKRESADYDLNQRLSLSDARLLNGRVRRVIDQWRGANTPEDRDFKHALAILVLLKGQLRQD